MKKYQLSPPEYSSRIDYRAELNDQQLEVVTAGNGPLLVVAGAGSGKTRALTYRVANLIDRGINPSRIVLCTFTNKAAKEMLARVDHLVAGSTQRVWGGTFHHLANRILREHCPVLGYHPGFSIIDQDDSREVVAECMAAWEKDQGKGADAKMMPRPAVLADQISFAVNTQTPLDQVILRRAPTLVPVLDEMLSIARGYRDRKRSMNVMDFDDLLTNLLDLLRDHPEISDLISGEFLHVLVDEYQDTNALQCELVDLLARINGNLTVVGDDAQSIYGFRGAEPDNMLTFKDRWPETQLHKLEINYRSTPQILALANRSIEHNRDQLPKVLSATRPDGPLPVLASVRDTAVQAAFVAQRINELTEEGTLLSDMAVLYRAHSHSLELQVELTRRGIPYIVRSGVRFFEQAHIKDVLAHLRLVENPRDELSWMRVLKLQPGIGRTTAMKIWQTLEQSSDPLLAARQLPAGSLGARVRTGFKRLQGLLEELARQDVRQHTSLALQTVLDQGYRDLLPNLYTNPESRKEDIEQLVRYSDHFESIQIFLSELNLLASFSTEEVRRSRQSEDHLVLSTVHQAKGLEWKKVFILGLSEGTFPHPWALTEREGDDQEERRLFYVAITRAKDELYLVSPLVADRSRGRRVLLRPSRFLDEVDSEDLLDRWSVEEGGEAT